MSDAVTRIESDVPTVHVADATPPPSAATGARFTPGTTVANRYRIVSLLGRGGMGEVYRAEDLRLSQQVALKFLPPALASRPGALEHLFAEVRIGRQISHPNVCRLYDIVEVEGQYFIAMEYVDGEDLASLLRRVGKLPAEKVIAIARDLFSGLAAVHEHGVVHRDIKPANVMLDSRGRARLTDFGLAAVAAELATNAEVAGTPAYMAPEQLSGDLVTPRSDLYSIALMLFELFTGRRLFEGRSVPEIATEHNTPKPRLSSIISGLEPAIERAVLRCLSEDPAERPASAREVLREFPSDDPLAAALGAGETPSPALVAAAGETGTVTARTGALLFAGFVVALLVAAFATSYGMIWGRVESKSPDALSDRASEVVRAAGYEPRSLHHRGMWWFEREAWRWLRANKLEDPPAPLLYIQRLSPTPLEPITARRRVSVGDPPDSPSTGYVVLDAQGKLVYFEAAEGARRTQRMSKDALRNAAAIPGSLKIEESNGAVVRAESPLPWRRIPLSESLHAFPSVGPLTGINAVMSMLSLLLTAIGAAWNIRARRVDTRGAVRLGSFIFAFALVGYLAFADHTSTIGKEYRILSDVIGTALFFAALPSLAYIAIEPYVRRHMPHLLIGWSRLLAGRWRDPMVARDVQIGLLLGLASVALHFLTGVLPGADPIFVVRHIEEPDYFIYSLCAVVAVGSYFTLMPALIVVAIRSVSNTVVGASLLALTFIAAQVPSAPTIPGALLITASVSLLVISLVRFGLLAFAATWAAIQIGDRLPLSLDFSTWYAGRAMLTMAILTALALYGWRYATARGAAYS